MKFHDYYTMYMANKKMGSPWPGKSPGDFYFAFQQAMFPLATRGIRNGPFPLESDYNRSASEWLWYNDGCPYYRVWPKIIKPLIKLDLDKAPMAGFELPTGMQSLMFQFPVGQRELGWEHEGQWWEPWTMLICFNQIIDTEETRCMAWIDIGERPDPESNLPMLIYRQFPVNVENVGDALGQLPVDEMTMAEGVPVPEDFSMNMIRLAVTACMISHDDADLIRPDVLADDRENFQRTGDQKYVDRARRRGKLGWDLGKNMEVSPHTRDAHWSHFWVGPGRKKLIFKKRRGSIIHREKIEKIPTGHAAVDNDDPK